MRVPDGVVVGVATHTGLSRSVNEDDYVVVALAEDLPDPSQVAGEPVVDGSLQGCTLFAAVADGMGGVAGGAEASRAGLRGFAAGFLRASVAEAGAPDREAMMRNGFASACERVVEQAELVPALRDMGTTLTVLALYPDSVVMGHIGDTRAYRLRDGLLERLSTDHASEEHSHWLLRCVGGGQPAEEPDVLRFDARPGDRFLLCSDGVWGTVALENLVGMLASEPPDIVAEELVDRANRAGGPDNATALVLELGEPRGESGKEVVLPAEESSRLLEVAGRRQRLGGPLWPWLLMLFGVLLIAISVLQWFLGFDLFTWVAGLF
ncbi:MAG: protein phosphatase 2C domain-containing protein [Planctomycetota bacterium]|nr:protein phosphatase 2C domain-containing protein [Planctomycetota bacterium]